MSVHTSAHPGLIPGTDPSGTRTPPRSVGRVIAGSLLAGLLTCLILLLVVVPGAGESTVTGAALLAFGFGWVLMRVLTERLTDQPQRWTTVPAVAMTVVGGGLVLTTPDDSTLTALNWVWPPAMLALTVWMFTRMRRALVGRGRWLLLPVLAVLVAASVGAIAQNLSTLGRDDVYPAPGTLYSVGDHRLHLDCRGSGSPTVVLVNGLGEISASWARITDAVSPSTQVCAYDRAGQGWSDDSPTPQDALAAARDLHALLAAAGIRGPLVLAGHSIGGPYALTYAATYPDQVAGLVLLDSSSPRQFTELPRFPLQYAVMRRGFALLPTLTRLGLGPLTTPSPHLPAPDAEVVHAMGATPRAARNSRDDLAALRSSFAQSQALTGWEARPLAVITASGSLSTPGWRAAQSRLAGLSAHSLHRTVTSTHEGLIQDPHGAGESVRAITAVVRAVRTDAPLAAR